MGRRVSIRQLTKKAAADLATVVGAQSLAETVVARCQVGVVVCEVRVGPAQPQPTPASIRAACRRDILAVLAGKNEPIPRKKLLRALIEAGTPHGAGTVAKALADLTRDGTLVNPRDRRGYRLAAWPARGRRDQPSLPGCEPAEG